MTVVALPPAAGGIAPPHPACRHRDPPDADCRPAARECNDAGSRAPAAEPPPWPRVFPGL